MAFTMNPIGKNKCSYSPMKEKGLISPIPKTGETTVDIVDSKTGKTTKVTKTGDGSYTKGGNVVTLAETQKVKPQSTRTESYAQKIARLKEEA